MERWRNSLYSLGAPQKIFDEDLVLPTTTSEEIKAFASMIAAADVLTALGVGFFCISEQDFYDPDGTIVRYIGDRQFTDFTALAHTFTKEVDGGKSVEEAARIAESKHPKVPPKNQGNP